MGANVAAFFGAAAALAAAVFSGLSLYVTGKREERKWRRESLLIAYQRFIELSFDRSFLAVRAVRARRGLEGTTALLPTLRTNEEKLHAEYDSLITRLRLLAPESVVDAAVDLHDKDNALVNPALGGEQPITDAEVAEFERNRDLNRQAKEKMLTAARATLGLDSAAAIDERYWGRSSVEW